MQFFLQLILYFCNVIITVNTIVNMYVKQLVMRVKSRMEGVSVLVCVFNVNLVEWSGPNSKNQVKSYWWLRSYDILNTTHYWRKLV